MAALQRLAARSGASPLLLAAIAALVGGAWIALWLWERSPEARFLHHAGATGASQVVEIALFVAGWTVMIVAMMLPTTVPLLSTFAALVGRRPRAPILIALMVGGYLATWVGFGLAVYAADRVLHAIVDATPWLAAHPQLIAGGVLLAGGAYQFTPLKYRCLDECRSPLGFVLSRWTGTRPRFEALRIGIAHGLFCLGCCWSLMLVMFALGLGNLAWMFALAVAMTVEKNLPIGRGIGRPLGALLLLAGIATLAG
jgi:predicted metal-binding membrane protein